MGRLPPAWIVVWTLLCISGQRGSRVASGVLPSLLEGRAAEHESWRVRLLRRCGLLSEGLVSGLFPSEGLVSGLGVRPHPAALPKRARPARPAACTGCPRPGLDGLPLGGDGAHWARLCCRDCCCYRLLDLKASSCVLPPRPSSSELAPEGCHFAFQCEV